MTTVGMRKITERGDLLSVNGFCELYGVTREECMRLVLRNFVYGIHIPDQNRYFIDNARLLKDAKDEGVKPSELVRRYCRHSKK